MHYSHHLMHFGKKLRSCCFPGKYVSSPDTRSFLLYFHKAQSCFYLLGNLTTSHESSGMLSWVLFLLICSHIGPIFIPTIGGLVGT